MKKIVFDATTGESYEVDMTEEEIQRKEARRLQLESAAAAKALAEQQVNEAKESALAKLMAIGLTEEEAKAIAG